jgi:hypothetical protein
VPVFSTDPERDFCFSCFMSGDYFDKVLSSEERGNMLGQIREISHVASARVFHAGDGAFQLVINLKDGRVVMPGAAAKFAGQKMVVPFVVGAGSGWGVMVRAPVETDGDWFGDGVALPDVYDDEELVQFVQDQNIAIT